MTMETKSIMPGVHLAEALVVGKIFSLST